MTASLTWPGDERAGDVFSDAALLTAMLRVEAAWLDSLVRAGVAPDDAQAARLEEAVGRDDVATLAARAEAGGNPVIALLALLRERLGDSHASAAHWVHRGLTSQDVLDTALMCCARDAAAEVRRELQRQLGALARLMREHRRSSMVARTLTQHAVPTTFAAKVAGWARALVDCAHEVDALEFRAQFGGAAGTLAGTVELARRAGVGDAVGAAQAMATRAAEALGIEPAPPWHTDRGAVTRIGDALARCTDAFGRIANDVLVLSRPEIGELAEATGGGSSTMPQKANPVLSVLVRRAALAAPQLAATLHLAAAEVVDERPDGAWHVEWATLQTLARRAVVAAAQTSEVLTGLRVDVDRMRATLMTALPGVLDEQRALAGLTGASDADDPTGYLGANDVLVDDVLARISAMTNGAAR